MKINIHAAKTNFSRLLARVAEGEDVVIARSGRPIARIIRLESAHDERRLGLDQDKIEISSDFDAPLPDGVLSMFLGTENSGKNEAAKKRRAKRG